MRLCQDFGEIENRGWEKFTSYSKVIVLVVVREFYANVEEREDDFVFVRGKKVPLSRTIINEFFRLNDLGQCYHE